MDGDAAVPTEVPNSPHMGSTLAETDADVHALARKELERQRGQIELIASEIFVSRAVLEAQATAFSNTTVEGYPGRRFHGGVEHADALERIAVERACRQFGCKNANVQAHSGSQANQVVLFSLLKPGDTILSMSLATGGHLSHGARANMSGIVFNAVQYGVRKQDGLIDYDEVEHLARTHKPKLVITGGSSYPRAIDFARFRKIADEVGAKLLVDMAHFANLVASGNYPNPFPHVHMATTTTYKTLRGPRGAIILWDDDELSNGINAALFPGVQGSAHVQAIAAKAVCFGEALRPEFREYGRSVLENARVLAQTLAGCGLTVVTGGTDTPLLLVDLRPKKLTGDVVSESLERAGLTCNKNLVPFDPEKPAVTSGLRFGVSAGTTRSFRREEFRQIGNLICEVIEGLAERGPDNTATEKSVRTKVEALCLRFSLYEYL